jgi:hypothetical protein
MRICKHENIAVEDLQGRVELRCNVHEEGDVEMPLYPPS